MKGRRLHKQSTVDIALDTRAAVSCWLGGEGVLRSGNYFMNVMQHCNQNNKVNYFITKNFNYPHMQHFNKCIIIKVSNN